MRDLSAFFDRFDAMKPSRPAEQALTDPGLREAAQSVIPLYVQMAERADIDLEALFTEQGERVRLLPDIVVKRSLASGADVRQEILSALMSVAGEAFLAGVLWEQERNLPDLGGEG